MYIVGFVNLPDFLDLTSRRTSAQTPGEGVGEVVNLSLGFSGLTEAAGNSLNHVNLKAGGNLLFCQEGCAPKQPPNGEPNTLPPILGSQPHCGPERGGAFGSPFGGCVGRVKCLRNPVGESPQRQLLFPQFCSGCTVARCMAH